MSTTILTPTTVNDPASAWTGDANAVGYPNDEFGAQATGAGKLALGTMTNRLGLPVGDQVVGFEVEIWGRTGGPIIVEDTFTDTAGTLLSAHDGELNADWQKPFTGSLPTDLLINSQGMAYYPLSQGNNGGEHFLTSYTPASADYAVEATIYRRTARADRAEIYARAAIPYRFYTLGFDASAGHWFLRWQTSSGVGATLGTYTGDLITVDSSATCRLECRGTSIRGYVNGVLRFNFTDSTITANGYPGLRLDAGAGSGAFLTVAYDLGSPTVVIQARYMYGTANGNSYSNLLEASNDGVNWVNAYTGMPPMDVSPGGTFAWSSERDFTSNITGTAYRYWRIVINDPGGDGPPDIRVGDFRLYTSGGIVTPSAGSVKWGGGSGPLNWSALSNPPAFIQGVTASYVLGSYQAAYSATPTTSNLSDGSISDTSTSIASTGTAGLTAFYDMGAAVSIQAARFTANSTGVPATWILDGANSTSGPWTSLATNTAYGGGAPFSVAQNLLTGSYRYYRLSLKPVAGSSTITLFDWRIGYDPLSVAPSFITDVAVADQTSFVRFTGSGGGSDGEGLQFDYYKVETLLSDTLNVSLSKDGTTTNGAAKTVNLSPYNAYYILGSPTDLWGGVWSIGEVRDALFSVLLERSSSSAVPWVDAARVTIYHTLSGGSLMALREQVRQQILIGRETTLGTTVPANVRLRHARIQPQPAPEFRDHRPAGEKLANHQLVLREAAQGPIEGIPTYDEMGYLLQSLVARPSTTTLQASTAFRHVFTFDNRARDGIASYTAEYGDMWSRAHRVAAMIVNSLDLALRQDGMDLGGSVIAQAITDGITMTNGAATVQTLTQSGTGTYALRFRGQETASLTAGVALTASAVETALRALPFINASTQLTVAGAAGGPFTITFGNSAAGPFMGLRQPLLEVRTLSGSPTAAVAMTTAGGHVELTGVPILPRHVEFFLTPTLASLASSKISEAFVTGFNMANRASPVYNLDRASTSWFNYAEPSNIDVGFSALLHANSNGMSFLPQGRSDTILYLRILATGPVIGASSFNHRLQIDCPVKISEFGPFSENQDIYAFEYGFKAAFDEATNSSLIITLDNGVASY